MSLEDTFKLLDLNGDGFIDKSELAQALRKSGVKEEQIPKTVDEAFKKTDIDGDERISLQEFKDLVTQAFKPK